MNNAVKYINFRFPSFGLSIAYDEQQLINARFFNPALENLPEFNGDICQLGYEIRAQLAEYLKNPQFKFNLPYQLNGTPHQLKIWQVMQTIDCGKTMTYGQVANLIGSAPRAVGGACGKNPLPVIVPCHRIIAMNNKLGGFNSGNIFFSLGIKRWLLNHEGVMLNN